MENKAHVKALYAHSSKGKLHGVLQIAVLPTILLEGWFYIEIPPTFPIGIVILSGMLFMITFGILGYYSGPLVVSRRRLRNFCNRKGIH
jgi:hypothetical protein